MDHPDEQIMLLKPQKAKQADETGKIIDLTIFPLQGKQIR